MSKIILISNSMWNFYNFRMSLIFSLRDTGYEVILFAPFDGFEKYFIENNFKCINLYLSRRGINPLKDIFSLRQIFRYLAKIKPAAVVTFTIKPNLYTSLISLLLKIKLIPNITGLGTIFSTPAPLRFLFLLVYRLLFKKHKVVFFQNQTDLEIFVKNKIVKIEQARLIPGSGINLKKYHGQPLKREFKSFILIARILKEKGILEYLKAAALIAKRYPQLNYYLLGPIEKKAGSIFSEKNIMKLCKLSSVTYLGCADSALRYIIESDCVVLPSYREGLSRVLLEALALARPIITTNTSGCKELVEENKNGFICKIKDIKDLAEKMIKMIELSPEERFQFGLYGRSKAEREFSEEIIINAYCTALKKLL